MIIRAGQIEALSDDARRRLIDEMAAHFSRLWPKKVEGLGEGYRAWLEMALEAAKLYGLDTQQSAARYTNLWFVWGPHFEKEDGFQWALEILSDPRRTAALKVHQLAHRTSQELRSRTSRVEKPIYER